METALAQRLFALGGIEKVLPTEEAAAAVFAAIDSWTATGVRQASVYRRIAVRLIANSGDGVAHFTASIVDAVSPSHHAVPPALVGLWSSAAAEIRAAETRIVGAHGSRLYPHSDWWLTLVHLSDSPQAGQIISNATLPRNDGT